MTNVLIRLGVSAGAVLLLQWALERWAPPEWRLLGVDGWPVAVIFAIVLGILNALVRPILMLVTCPINIVTLGLFTFVVNAAVFWLAAQLVPGIRIDGFLGALIGSVAVTACLSFVEWFRQQ
jgi:putative membrane protein